MVKRYNHSNTLSDDLELLTQLCAIDSKTDNTINVQAVLRLVERKLQDLSFDVQFVASSEDPNQRLLYAKRSGHKNAPHFAFISHADTVFAASECQIKEGWLWGSGVADNKGGIVCALRTIAQLDDLQSENHIMSPHLHFICSCSEETGSLGFHEFFQQIGSICDYVFGFEPATGAGDFISERNGNRWYEVEIEGIGSHAGRFGEPSLNAAHEAAFKTVQWLSVVDESQKMKLNIGSVVGGDGHFNVVCSKVKLKIDMRFPSQQIRDQLHNHFLKVLHHSYTKCAVTEKPTVSSYEIKDDCPAMAKSKNTKILDQLVHFIGQVEDRSCRHSHSGGAADINYFSHADNICVDGLGPVAVGMHTKQERVEIQSLATRPYALALLMNDILKNVFLRGAIDEREFIKSDTMEV